MRNLLIIFIGITFYSCGTGNSSSDYSSTDTLVYKIEKAEAYSDFKLDKKDSLRTECIIHYPFFEDNTLNDFIVKSLIANRGKASSPYEVTENFVKTFDSLAKSDPEYLQYWTSQTTMKVLLQRENLIAFSTDFYEYTGGAHGIYGTSFVNYDLKSKSIIKLNDLFKGGYENQLTSTAENIFRKNEGLEKGKGYEGYFFDNNTFKLPDNFSITDSGILFQYGIYEIKPYVSGVTNLLIPYSEISGLIPKESILHRFTKHENI